MTSHTNANIYTKEELKNIVPEIDKNGTIVVRLSDIPNPYRTEFSIDSGGSTMPLFEDEGICHYVWDWEKWLNIRFRKNYIHRHDDSLYEKIVTDEMTTKEYLFNIILRDD